MEYQYVSLLNKSFPEKTGRFPTRKYDFVLFFALSQDLNIPLDYHIT
jgi:hypothetical protein